MADNLFAGILAILLLLAGVIAIRAARRKLELFVLCIEDGRLTYARGRIPRQLLTELLDVMRATQRGRVLLRCRIEEQRPHLEIKGDVDPDTQIVLRNLLGLWPAQRLRTAPLLPPV